MTSTLKGELTRVYLLVTCKEDVCEAIYLISLNGKVFDVVILMILWERREHGK